MFLTPTGLLYPLSSPPSPRRLTFTVLCQLSQSKIKNLPWIPLSLMVLPTQVAPWASWPRWQFVMQVQSPLCQCHLYSQTQIPSPHPHHLHIFPALHNQLSPWHQPVWWPVLARGKQQTALLALRLGLKGRERQTVSLDHRLGQQVQQSVLAQCLLPYKPRPAGLRHCRSCPPSWIMWALQCCSPSLSPH